MHFGDLCLYIHSFWEGEEVHGAHHLCCHQPTVPFLMDGVAWSFLIFRAAVTSFCDQGIMLQLSLYRNNLVSDTCMSSCNARLKEIRH